MSVKDDIKRWEKALQSYKNNMAFSIKGGNKIRERRYQILIKETEDKIRDLERDLPVLSNDRLREQIDIQNETIKVLKGEIESLKEKIVEHENKIDNFLKPKVIEVPKIESKQCPRCKRMIELKSPKSMTVHQTRWCKGGDGGVGAKVGVNA